MSQPCFKLGCRSLSRKVLYSAITVRSIFCDFFLVVIGGVLPVMLPSEILKPPTDPHMRGFPIVWKLLLLHDSLSSGHRTGKGQFSFQSQRKTMPKNVQTTA